MVATALEGHGPGERGARRGVSLAQRVRRGSGAVPEAGHSTAGSAKPREGESDAEAEHTGDHGHLPRPVAPQGEEATAGAPSAAPLVSSVFAQQRGGVGWSAQQAGASRAGR
ncbi:hypothetical protein [Streptomyces sp. TRM70350]|uniref:hypothetical protein n=1 Tax=Streptomyces sp. TRM70350 TaxID=2856165 RepID=UPI001C437BC2|nr:hypothetical protein [Streptomyces sp. TRM70350]